MSMTGNITVSENNGKVDIYNISELRGNVKHILKRDPETKEFPSFTIECDSKAFIEGDTFIFLCIPDFKFCSDDVFGWNKEDKRNKCSDEMNPIHMSSTDHDEIPVFIFVKEVTEDDY